jgi:hypothetical protein
MNPLNPDVLRTRGFFMPTCVPRLARLWNFVLRTKFLASPAKGGQEFNTLDATHDANTSIVVVLW